MTDHTLPDDWRQWPRDPFKLLGVRPGVAPRDLKRAYTRLIRVYKPEHHPEAFGRLREAYETLQRIVEHGNYLVLDVSGEGAVSLRGTSEANASSGDSPAAVHEADSAPRPAAPRALSREEQLDECWRWAIEGDAERAYRGLCELHAQAPHLTDACLRIYWLLAIDPRLDRERSPADWLAAGLQASRLAGPLRELYRRELAANPAEAQTARSIALVDAPAADGHLVDLVVCRWNAVARLGQAVEAIEADLERVGPRLRAGDSDEAWARLLLAAADQLAFAEGDRAAKLLAHCDAELNALVHLQFQLSGELDRLEFARELGSRARSLARRTPVHDEFLEIVRLSWTCDIGEIWPRFMAYLGAVAAAPEWSLKNFDAVAKSGLPLLSQFRIALRMLDHWLDPSEEARTDDELTATIVDFAREIPSGKYADWRLPLLGFCLREVIMPEQVAESLASHREFHLTNDEHASQPLENDLALICVCHACRLFWA